MTEKEVSEPEKQVVNQEKKEPTIQAKVSVLQLFKYATKFDLLLMFWGSIAAIINGATLPVMTIVFGDIIQALVIFNGSQQAKINVDNSVRDGVIKMVVIGITTLVCSYIQMSFWMLAGENQTQVF